MVKVRERAPTTDDGSLDAHAWLDALVLGGLEIDDAAQQELLELCAFVRGFGDSYLVAGADMAQLALGVGMDEPALRACLLYLPLRHQLATATACLRYGDKAVQLAEAVVRVGGTSLLELSNARVQTSEAQDQVDNIRRMLVSLIDDPRVAIIKLSERIVALRRAKEDSADRQTRIAREALWVFAPLANRLGVWRFKWELEDLALRYLDPSSYKTIAASLDGRREEREREVARTATLVSKALAERGIEAELGARAKHIYSIWQKMRKKRIGFDDVYDVRAIRILVETIADCYAALGVVHSLFRHVPNEFDDYVANPKENGYRSIHTAVIGPDGKTLEIQIRTRQMHYESELGVCAHWVYKDTAADDESYQDKMNWLRRVLELDDGMGDFAEALRQEVADERIYVNTPRGHVLDLPAGATALDFAYRLHTDIGHAARGCLIDGQAKPLQAPLATGQMVEIVPGDQKEPKREWLEHSAGYVTTTRARSKIHTWFRSRPPEELRELGRQLLADGARRLGASIRSDLPQRLAFESWDALHEAAGRGTLQFDDIAPVLEREGVQLGLLETELKAQEVVLKVVAEDRDGLLMELMAVVSRCRLSLSSIAGNRTQSAKAELELKTQIEDLSVLVRLLDGLGRVPGVLEVKRTL